MNELRRFTEDQLIEELARRRAQRTTAHPEHWCHECRNYAAWNEVERPRDHFGAIAECPDDYNPCAKGHEMQFAVPEGYPDGDDGWGFYRRVCADRVLIDEGGA